MKKLFTLSLILLFMCNCGLAQQYKTNQAFGEVDMADLTLTSCSFEKDANAMVLLDKGVMTTNLDSVVVNYHMRIKIFNSAANSEANISLSYYSRNNLQQITQLEAQTINLEDNHIVYTKVEPSQIYTQTIDKYRKAIIFAFPKVKPGCIIEYRYKKKTMGLVNPPNWYFQNSLPVRYSELTGLMSKTTRYKVISRGNQPFVTDTLEKTESNTGVSKKIWAKANIPSPTGEKLVPKGVNNSEYIMFQLNSFEWDTDYKIQNGWHKIAFELGFDDNFGVELSYRLNHEDTVLNKAKALPSKDDKIAYIFNVVKNTVKWNKKNRWYTDDGVRQAWARKEGNSTEVNLILLRLLTKAGINAQPLVVSTRDHDIIDPAYPNIYSLNKTVIYIPIDSNRYYVLDATNKYNLYTDIPIDLLNTYGLMVKREGIYVSSKLILLQNDQPAQRVVIINGNINPGGRVTGTADISSYSYDKTFFAFLYSKLDKKEFINLLHDGNSSLKINDVAVENMDVDSLPLLQKIKFNLELTADDKYIYFNPNVLTPEYVNPFLKEKRVSDIDFENCASNSINGHYKLPDGYKVDVMPANVLVRFADKSITFKRVVGEANGFVEVHYTITRNRSKYAVAEYPALHQFFKKMYDMLNEPIVLKKV